MIDEGWELAGQPVGEEEVSPVAAASNDNTAEATPKQCEPLSRESTSGSSSPGTAPLTSPAEEAAGVVHMRLASVPGSAAADENQREPTWEAPAARASKLDLKQEVALLHRLLDRILALALLLAALGLEWLLLPTHFAIALVLGFGVSVYSAHQTGTIDSNAAGLLALNVFVLAPYNFMLWGGYWLSLLTRLPTYRLCQFLLIPPMTWFKVWKAPWDATFEEWLRILPKAYDIILPTDPKLKPFANIDEGSQDEVAQALRHSGFVHWLSKISAEHIPKGLLNSLAFRLIFFMLACPTLGWWLVGPCYVPLLSLKAPESEESQESKPTSPPVSFYMPKCRFLKVARNEFGEELGKQKCLNE